MTARSPTLTFLALLLAVSVIFAFGIGRYPIGTRDLFDFVLAATGLGRMEQDRYDLLSNLILDIRAPRIAAAVLVGASLATAGAAFQAVFRNPLVSPGLLGVLAGAGFGASVGILISGNWVVVQLLAFACAILAVLFALGIANLFGNASLVMLILGGIISGALFSALLTLVKYAADPGDQLPAITYWLMGNLGTARIEQLRWAALPVFAGILIVWMLGRALDAMSMGDDEAHTLGVPVALIRYAVIAVATMVSAISVSMVGIIGWIGLIIPHIARLMIGPMNMRLIPASALLGASFLVGADILARSLSGIEIPIGIVTEIVGIPIFVLVLSRVRRGWT
ncbi:iron ABC transporter permease [Paracoccus methylovorus]|uniref:Transport system permease protein n=2 Tax=Paracoccus TaxID=265 RepID=A1B6H0_PARDP|nr:MULTISPECIES: iron ABC transporter permease [Paracoccus]ABL71114.1 transport system permease protein [Paracoccus denitrificans PD1222]MBB4628288.1 iron complex transport system permease protein [Paracoccus denitrificans]MCU7429343.1 iron ABC transporter permease [Paracoccus denitrificans]QAR27774.1 iron ABC transporter permease [Paracoccus denitrificans]QRZ15222.1 iron ABC transporter permease [Paracoccus methylovorus]